MNWHALIGITAGIIHIISVIPYIKSMVLGSTRPNAISYGIWSLLSLITLAAQLKAGASWSIIILGTVTCSTLVITVLSLRGYGYKKYYTLDWVCFCVAIIAIISWKLTNDPLVAMSISICTNLFSALPTVIKTYREPHTELPISWLLLMIASVLSLCSTTIWNAENVIYSAYSLLESATIGGLAFFGQRKNV